MTPKYYDKIRAAQAADGGAPCGEFDFSVLKRGGGLGARLAQHRLVHAFLRRFWPIGRVGGLGWVVRHADVSEVRRRDKDFEAPYGLEMRELTGGADFALGMQDGPAYQRQLSFMRSVVRRGDIGGLIAPNARRLAEALVLHSGGEIDAVEDLLLRVSVETCADYFGLDLEDPIAFAEWLMSISTLLFADYLGDPAVRRLALEGAARIRRVMDAAIRKAHAAAERKRVSTMPGAVIDEAASASASRHCETTLAGRLVELQLTQGANGPSDGEIRAILIGMAVGYVPTGAGAGGNILDVLLRRPVWFAKAQTAARARDDKRLTAILREAMRFSPPINPGVPRYVAETIKLRNTKLPRGTMIIAASMPAMFDPRAVRNANRFDPDRDLAKDLQFGGDYIHYCIGEPIADAVLLASFKPLLAQTGIRRQRGGKGRLEKTGPFPRHLHLSFDPVEGHRNQSMVTICVPLKGKVGVDALNTEIGKLGNPVGDDLRAVLDKTGIIHFAHISAVEGERDRRGGIRHPAFLIVELSADGPAELAVAAFANAGGKLLLPLFEQAAGTKSGEDLKALLTTHIRRLVAGRILPSRKTASGLNFPGTPELSVARVTSDASLAIEARRHLDDVMRRQGGGGVTATGILKQVRERVRQGPQRAGLARPRSQALGVSRPGHTSSEALAALFADWRFSGKFIAGTLVFLAAYYMLAHGIDTWPKAGALAVMLGRIAISLLAAGLIAVAIAGIWHEEGAQRQKGQRQPLGVWLASHAFGVSAFTLALAFAHFVIVQRSIGVAGWDGAPIGARLSMASATLVATITTLVVGLLVLAVIVAGLVVAVLALLRRSETRSPVEDFDPPFKHVKSLLARENPPGYVQNHIIAVTPLKTDPRWLRRMTLGLAFWGIEKMVQHQFRPGFVLDIGTIHFARWFRLPGTDKLIFLSNYDGSWESYLEDFITKAHVGQTAVWSNGVGFPRTRFLMLGGASAGAKFKRWVRRQQVETPFWYSRFPTMTTSQMRTNALICEGLAKACTDSDAQAWVDLFGSRPRPNTALEFEEIQSLAFSGMSRLRSAELLPLRIREGDERWRDWLAVLAGGGATHPLGLVEGAHTLAVAFGETPPGERAAAVAFSADGLRRMGLDGITYRQGGGVAGTTLNSFPEAFVDGMASAERGRILGDAGDSAAARWSWAGPASAPHAVLILYAQNGADLDHYVAAVRQRLDLAYGVSALPSIRMQDLPADVSEIREPFGFHDGISQPIIRGTRRFHNGANPIHVVEPGEFILGYPDNRGDIPPSPVVAAEHDRGILPDIAANLPARFPDFGGARADAPRDLGRNGSFLVIRQLEQDVAAFKRHTEELALQVRQVIPDQNVDGKWIAARMVGRWQDGSSLARHPYAPGKVADNDFLFGVDDPQGTRCPYGAHIRRAFPRDSLSPEHKAQLSISNRHRLLRRGRPYLADPNASAASGLVFMCLNADIERQFEFVQQTWISAPTFHGMAGEVDPIATLRTSRYGNSGGSFTIQTPGGPVTLRNVQSFVTVRNGGYFFLPSRSALRFLATLPARKQA